MSTKRFDFHLVMRRISTWLAIISASAAGGLFVYVGLPDRVQAAFPDWALLTLGMLAMASPMLVPLATSFKQKALP